MSEATGVGGARGSAGGGEDELPGWPEGAPELSIDEPEQRASDVQEPFATPGDVQGMSAAPNDDIQGMSAAPNDDIQGMSAAPNDDIQGMSYEQARDALVATVNELERGGTTLEQSLALWERGEALAARCESWLTGARARLEAARAGAQSRSGG